MSHRLTGRHEALPRPLRPPGPRPRLQPQIRRAQVRSVQGAVWEAVPDQVRYLCLLITYNQSDLLKSPNG